MSDVYESPQIVDEYLLFHYGRKEDILPPGGGPADAFGFPERTVAELLPPGKYASALDAGCAVGRSAFELSRSCASVTGVDFSAALVAAAETMRRDGRATCRRHLEGRLSDTVALALPDGVDPGRVRFIRGDAMDLPADWRGFEVVHAANLLCRLPDPRKFLARLPSLVAPGGFLILTTPCTWLESFTPPDRWPPGATFDWLRDALEPAFSLTLRKDMPFLIREHARKFQWTVAMATVWRRR